MTLLEIIRAVAINTALTPPSTAIGATDLDIINLVQFSIDTANDAVRRFDWGELRETMTVTGTGAAIDHPLPAYFKDLIAGGAVFVGTAHVRGGLSADEWAALPPQVGTPRFYRIIGKKISFWPYLANGATATITYQCKCWCSNDTDSWTLDTQTARIPADVIIKGTIARQRRHIGQEFSDHMAEYEASLTDYAAFDQRSRSP